MNPLDRNKPIGDYYTGRKSLLQISADKNTPLRGKTKPSWGQTLNRWVTIITRPRESYRLYKQDKMVLQQELRDGVFSSDKGLKERRASVTLDHMQSVIKASQKKNSADRKNGQSVKKDRPGWIDAEAELERTRRVRIGQGFSDPDKAIPWSQDYADELRQYYEEFMAETKTSKERNKDTAVMFESFSRPDHKLEAVRSRIQEHRREFYRSKARLEDLPFYSSKESFIAKGETRPMTRKELESKIKTLGDKIIAGYEEVSKIMAAKCAPEGKVLDHTRENRAVMDSIGAGMVQWWDKHKPELIKTEQLLRSEECELEEADDNNRISLRKAKGWVRRYRRDTLGQLEAEFVKLSKTAELAKENEKRLQELSSEIYAGRLMAMRLEGLINNSGSATEIASNINQYLADNGLTQMSPEQASLVSSRPYSEDPSTIAGPFIQSELDHILNSHQQFLKHGAVSTTELPGNFGQPEDLISTQPPADNQGIQIDKLMPTQPHTDQQILPLSSADLSLFENLGDKESHDDENN